MGTRKISRRGVIATALAAGVAGRVQGEERKVSKAASWDSVVIGAGVFGAWTAWHLRKSGQRVLLLDAFGAAHARASSGGESRLTRGSYGSDEVSPYAAPARATDVAGLPPAYISTMEFDPLRDEGILYALKLLAAGVTVELHSFPGTFHGSAMVTRAAVTRREGAERFAVLRRALELDG